MKEREQKLIDIMFEVAMVSADSMHGKSNEEIANWVRRQLEICGFKTEPVGVSWGMLIDQYE